MRVLVTILGLSTMLAAVACQNRQQEAPPANVSVTNEALGLRLASLPPEFALAVNQGRDLELVPANQDVSGLVTFDVGEEEHGINLIAAVKRHQRQIEEQPEADYMGGQELKTPFGTAFYSRGRFLSGVDEVEETVILLKHPTEDRLLTIRYRYPAGTDSSVRVQQLLDVLGELEGLGAPPPDEGTPSGE
jgi:hypothetical protein